MELGSFQLRLFVSVAVILGAALIALIVDYLKGSNEQLRERNIELLVRSEERERRTESGMAGGLKRPIVMRAPEVKPGGHPEMPERVIAVTPLSGPRRENSAAEPAKPPEAEAPAAAPESFRQRVVVVKPVAFPEAAPVEDAGRVSELPPGLHEAGVLAEMMERGEPFQGLVVAICINDFDQLRRSSPRAATVDLPESAERLIRSLVRQNEFACRVAEDEFLLACPGESGATAQRRLEQLSERLWDFQLRSLGSFSILFSWGAVEVRDETLADAVAAARERMNETRQGRKTLCMDFGLADRKAVNA